MDVFSRFNGFFFSFSFRSLTVCEAMTSNQKIRASHKTRCYRTMTWNQTNNNERNEKCQPDSYALQNTILIQPEWVLRAMVCLFVCVCEKRMNELFQIHLQ